MRNQATSCDVIHGPYQHLLMLCNIHSQFCCICLTVLSQPLFKLSRTAQGQVPCISCPTSTQPLPLEVLILSSCFNAPACFQLNELGFSQLWTAVYHRCAFNAIHFCSKQQAVIIQLCPEHHTQLLPFVHRFCHVRYSIWLVLKKKKQKDEFIHQLHHTPLTKSFI